MLEHGAISIFALPSAPQKPPTPPPPPLFGLSEFSSLSRSLFVSHATSSSSFLMEMPGFLIGDYYGAGVGAGQFISAENQKAGEQFTVDDLLNFSNEDEVMTDGNFFDNVTGNSTDSSTVTSIGSCNASISGCENHFGGYVGSRSFSGSPFSGELCVPYDDLVELEWLSNFVEDSFSAQENDLQSMHFISTITGKAQTPETSSSSETLPSLSSETLKTGPFFNHESPLPGKARSKRARTAPGDWSKRLLHLLTPTEAKPPKVAASKKRESSNSECSGRKCLHCGSEKTPQWRTGPMGPKTLCNACGVRYKSGRLVPEYRPAASPTFVSAKHSNSHRKVLELRRQKEVQKAQEHPFLSQTSYFGVSNGSDDFLIHHSGPDYSHLI